MKKDSIKLLNECHYGIAMAISSIDTLADTVQDSRLREQLDDSRKLHEVLGRETAGLLQRMGQEPPVPGFMAKSMAKLQTNARMTFRPSDSTAAALLSDGCHVGIKTIAKQLNRRTEADVQAREMARRVIGLEDKLSVEMRPYL